MNAFLQLKIAVAARRGDCRFYSRLIESLSTRVTNCDKRDITAITFRCVTNALATNPGMLLCAGTRVDAIGGDLQIDASPND